MSNTLEMETFVWLACHPVIAIEVHDSPYAVCIRFDSYSENCPTFGMERQHFGKSTLVHLAYVRVYWWYRVPFRLGSGHLLDRSLFHMNRTIPLHRLHQFVSWHHSQQANHCQTHRRTYAIVFATIFEHDQWDSWHLRCNKFDFDQRIQWHSLDMIDPMVLAALDAYVLALHLRSLEW